MTKITHTPVLVSEILTCLDIKPDENIIDGTIGEAGHTLEMLKKNAPLGKVLGIDADADQIKNSRLRLSDYHDRLILVNDSYAHIQEIVERNHFAPVHGILIDVGYSSWQIENGKRGFSFSRNEVLDMRYDQKGTLTAQNIVNEYPEESLRKILEEYGEVMYARQIAKKIVERRKVKIIKTTGDLLEVIESAIPKKFQQGKIHYATRTFQAIRIAVNQELENITHFLPQALSILAPGGRLAVISFHSLEDRIVKHFFQEQAKANTVTILTKKPITASLEELEKNPRSRSAKLRVIIKN